MQVHKKPSAYGIPSNSLSEGAVEKVLKDQLILANVRELAKYGMVSNTYYACIMASVRNEWPLKKAV